MSWLIGFNGCFNRGYIYIYVLGVFDGSIQSGSAKRIQFGMNRTVHMTPNLVWWVLCSKPTKILAIYLQQGVSISPDSSWKTDWVLPFGRAVAISLSPKFLGL